MILNYYYQWKRGGIDISGATTSAYEVVADDTDLDISCFVTAENSGGLKTASSNVVHAADLPSNTVAPAITGNPFVGQTLTIGNGTWSDNGRDITGYTYQWKLDGVNISAATSSTYVVQAGDKTHVITCAVTATNEVGAVSTTSSGVNAIDVPSNSVAPAITGNPYVGQLLTTSTGTWSGNGGTISGYTYVWKRGGAPITGATASTYTVQAEDIAQNITCTVTATNAAGSVSATGNTVVGADVPTNTVAPAITGNPYVGQTLTVGNGTWSTNGASISGYTYVWKRDGVAISGATASTYDVVTNDVTHAITCTVTATNAAGSANATSSSVTGADVPANTVLPAITGNPYVGQTLTSSTGTWNANGATVSGYTYQWKKAGVNISGETASTYVVVSGDAGSAITCAVTATNAAGSTSATSSGVNAANVPSNSVAPAITGNPYVGQTLTVSDGTWSANGATISGYTYQWKRDGVAISGATASTHVVVSGDISTSLTCTVTATNAAGSANATSSGVTGADVPSNTVAPAITGNPYVGQNL
jgi:hypothetical protein